MLSRTFLLVLLLVVVVAALALGHRGGRGNMLHRLGTAIHGR